VTDEILVLDQLVGSRKWTRLTDSRIRKFWPANARGAIIETYYQDGTLLFRIRGYHRFRPAGVAGGFIFLEEANSAAINFQKTGVLEDADADHGDTAGGRRSLFGP